VRTTQGRRGRRDVHADGLNGEVEVEALPRVIAGVDAVVGASAPSIVRTAGIAALTKRDVVAVERVQGRLHRERRVGGGGHDYPGCSRSKRARTSRGRAVSRGWSGLGRNPVQDRKVLPDGGYTDPVRVIELNYHRSARPPRRMQGGRDELEQRLRFTKEASATAQTIAQSEFCCSHRLQPNATT
jgi:hypothetical protein